MGIDLLAGRDLGFGDDAEAPRLALGARPLEVRWTVMCEGLGLVVLGLAAGAVAMIPFTRLLQGFLYEITVTDPTTAAAAAVVLLIAAAVAIWLPVRRAAAVDPAVVLRAE